MSSRTPGKLLAVPNSGGVIVTAEPVSLESLSNLGPFQVGVAQAVGMDDGTNQANAEHLVACWNACEHGEDDAARLKELRRFVDNALFAVQQRKPEYAGIYLASALATLDSILKSHNNPANNSKGTP